MREKTSNYFSDNSDVLFHLKKRVDWEAVFAWLSEAEKEAIQAKTANECLNGWLDVMETFGEVCGGPIAANAAGIDRSEYRIVNGEETAPKELVENMQVLKELGIAPFGVNPKYGGMGAPFFIQMVGCELLNRACPSTTVNASWYGAIAHIIEQFGNETLKNTYIPKIAEGLISGNMALTEPDAGSDLGALRTYGLKQADGTWKLYGTKRFITNGTAEISLVLAKNEKGSQGLSALSLFLCPRYMDGRENIKVSKLEEKVALHGSATAELAYDGSTAWLLGEEGEGFAYMLRLMNDSRIAVAFQGIGAMEGSLRLAQQYAEERKTWGKPIAQHELIAEILLDLEVELKACRSLAYQAAYNRSLMYLGEKYLSENDLNPSERRKVEEQLSKHSARVRRWTPLLKWWVGEKSPTHAVKALQVFGGYGFTTEYRAEWWVRESLIYAIYEGTSQIQALMCMKDTLKSIVRKPRRFIEEALAIKVKAITESDPLKKKLFKMKQMTHNTLIAILLKLVKTNAKARYSAHSDDDLIRLIKSLSREMITFENISPALLQAERLCEMQCLCAMSESLLWDAQADKERRWIAERFIFKALPRMQHLKTLAEQDDSVILSRLS